MADDYNRNARYRRPNARALIIMKPLSRAALFLLVCGAAAAAQQAPATYDIVLRNGRVMDPASGLDAVRNVGITRK